MPKRKESKYAGLFPTLEKFVNPDTTRQDMINLLKVKMQEQGVTASSISMAQEYVRIRQEKAHLKDALALLQLRLDALDQLLVASQEARAEGWGQYGAAPSMLRLVTGDAVQARPELYSSTTDREKLRQFFVEQHLVSELSPHWRTIHKLNADRLLAGEPPLPGTKVTAYTKIFYYPVGSEEPAQDDDIDF